MSTKQTENDATDILPQADKRRRVRKLRRAAYLHARELADYLSAEQMEEGGEEIEDLRDAAETLCTRLAERLDDTADDPRTNGT